jgi:hypothetical protein
MRQVRLPMENIKVTENRIRRSKRTPEEYQVFKKSIKTLGLSNPIIVTHNLELIAGYWRLKVFKELHEEDPNNVEFYDIPTIIVAPKEEVEDLKIDFTTGTDYMKDTAVDRLNMIYDPKQFGKKELNEFLGITKSDLAHRLDVGIAIRNGKLDDIIKLEDYKREKINHDFVYGLLLLQKEVDDYNEEVYDKKEFNINDWL